MSKLKLIILNFGRFYRGWLVLGENFEVAFNNTRISKININQRKYAFSKLQFFVSIPTSMISSDSHRNLTLLVVHKEVPNSKITDYH